MKYTDNFCLVPRLLLAIFTLIQINQKVHM